MLAVTSRASAPRTMKVAGAALLVGLLSSTGCSLLLNTSELSEGNQGGEDTPLVSRDSGTPDAPILEASSDAPIDDDLSHAYARVVLTDTPIHYYRLDETDGTTVKDDLGTADGQLIGTGDLTMGVDGAFVGSHGLAFAGDHGGILLSSVGDYVGRASFTFEMWFRPDQYDDAFRFLFGKNGSTDAGRQEYGVFVRTNSGIVLERFVDDGPRQTDAPLPAVTGSYYHIVFTYDGSTLRLFQDASLIASTDDTREATSNPAALYFGKTDEGAPSIIGALDEIAIYDKALSTAQITKHFQAGRPTSGTTDGGTATR